jgi:hypothetical protein
LVVDVPFGSLLPLAAPTGHPWQILSMDNRRIRSSRVRNYSVFFTRPTDDNIDIGFPLSFSWSWMQVARYFCKKQNLVFYWEMKSFFALSTSGDFADEKSDFFYF